jgi:hypothetical protein
MRLHSESTSQFRTSRRVYVEFNSVVQVPCIFPDNVILCPDDENFPSRLPSVSRSFELFQVASIWTFQQHARTPFSVRQVHRFLFQTQIWEDNCNRPDNVIIPGPDAILDKASMKKMFNCLDAQTLLWKLSVVEVQPSGY